MQSRARFQKAPQTKLHNAVPIVRKTIKELSVVSKNFQFYFRRKFRIINLKNAVEETILRPNY
jgi:hypothetical protein